MKGDAQRMIRFLGKNDRFEIPIYQRSYSWRPEQCAQLFRDLEMTIRNNKTSHFFGSLVSVAEKDNLLIIDGQQRITTVSLLLLALKNAIANGEKAIDDPAEESRIIYNKYLVDEYSKGACKLKLRHIPGDAETFEALFEGKYLNKNSNIVKNYIFFQNAILESSLSAEEIIEAISRLLIIDISIDKEDNPQLIFESINSTGVDLCEGDKVRNYVLMDLEIDPQTKFYKKYWKKIEDLTLRKGEQDGVGLFIRDFLTAKTSVIPNLASIYATFKKYCTDNESLLKNREDLFILLHDYASVYHYLLKPEDICNPDIAMWISFLNKQEVTPSYPYLVEVLLAWKNNVLTDAQTVHILDILDSYVFRRQICDLPTSSLNKIFADLHKNIMRFEHSIPYEDRLKRILLDKTGKARFPHDGEFKQALKEKNIYDMRSKNRKYIFARLENGLTLDAKVLGCKDVVYDMIENGNYTIEHIMPQTLNSLWKRDLGIEYEKIHNEWLHRLANLTLTAYNSKLGNKDFSSKVARNTFSDMVDSSFGFDESSKHLWLNEFPAKQVKWTVEEMKERAELLAERALQIWKPITTSFENKEKVRKLSIVNDPAESFTGSKPQEYSVESETFPVKQWVDLYVNVVSYLYNKDPEHIDTFAKSKNSKGIDGIFSPNPRNKYKQVADNIYLFSNNSTIEKLRILKILLDVYGIDDILVTIKDDPIANLGPKFEKYMLEDSPDKSNCIPTLSSLENRLREADVLHKSIFEITSESKLQEISECIKKHADLLSINEEIQKKYLSALNKYIDFVKKISHEL